MCLVCLGGVVHGVFEAFGAFGVFGVCGVFGAQGLGHEAPRQPKPWTSKLPLSVQSPKPRNLKAPSLQIR